LDFKLVWIFGLLVGLDRYVITGTMQYFNALITLLCLIYSKQNLLTHGFVASPKGLQVKTSFLAETRISSSSINVSTSSEASAQGTSNKSAKSLVEYIFIEEECLSSIEGADKFGECCSFNVVYDDCYEPFPIKGKTAVTTHMREKAKARKNAGKVRIDRISDGNRACGFVWTWVTDSEEGLRGTTYVELNERNEIEYMREIPEPLFKPGDATRQLLEALTKGAPPNPKVEYETKTPTKASDIASYLFKEVQGSSIDEAMRLFDEEIFYRDFNFEEPFMGKEQVKTFIEEFSFPGITFNLQRIDDGVISTCFTWDIKLAGAEGTIKGISFYELNPETKLIEYVRDIPESAIKPPILGKLARQLRPGLGVFQGVKLGSREGGK